MDLEEFVAECKEKRYDKYDIRDKLKKYLKERCGMHVDYRVCGHREILEQVYKELDQRV